MNIRKNIEIHDKCANFLPLEAKFLQQFCQKSCNFSKIWSTALPFLPEAGTGIFPVWSAMTRCASKAAYTISQARNPHEERHEPAATAKAAMRSEPTSGNLRLWKSIPTATIHAGANSHSFPKIGGYAILSSTLYSAAKSISVRSIQPIQNSALSMVTIVQKSAYFISMSSFPTVPSAIIIVLDTPAKLNMR